MNSLSSSHVFESLIHSMTKSEPFYPDFHSLFRKSSAFSGKPLNGNELSFIDYSNQLMILSHYLEKNPDMFDEAEPFKHPEWMRSAKILKNCFKAKPSEVFRSYSSGWCSKCGHTKENVDVYYIYLPNVKNLSYMALNLYFYSHFEESQSEKITFVVECSDVSDSAIRNFKKFWAAFPKWLLSRVETILLLHTSILFAEKCPIDLPKVVQEKILVVDDINDFFEEDDLVYFPKRGFSPISNARGAIPVSIDNISAIAYPCDLDLYITSSVNIFSQDGQGSYYIPFPKVAAVSLTPNDEGKINIKIRNDQIKEDLEAEENDDDENETETKKPGNSNKGCTIISIKVGNSKSFNKLWKELKYRIRMTKLFRAGDIREMCYSKRSCIGMQIAFALYIIASRNTGFERLAIDLFNSIVYNIQKAKIPGQKNTDVLKTAGSGANAEPVFLNLKGFIETVKEIGYIKEVGESLTYFVNKTDPRALQYLLPLFVEFANSVNDQNSLLKFSKAIIDQSDLLLEFFERYLFAKINNPNAIYSLISNALLSRNNRNNSVNPNPLVIKNKNLMVSRLLTSFLGRQDTIQMFGDLFTTKILDGFIRRKRFTNLDLGGICLMLPGIAYSCPEIINKDLPIILFNIIMLSFQSSSNYLKYFKAFISSISTFYQQSSEGSNSTSIDSNGNEICDLLEKNTDPIKTIIAGEKWLESINPEFSRKFHSFFEKTNLEEAPTVLSIKIATAMRFGISNVSEIKLEDLVNNLRTNLREDQISLAFEILSRKFDQNISNDFSEKRNLFFFIWAPIVSLALGSIQVSKQSFKLLSKLLPWSIENGLFLNLQGLESTQYVSDLLQQSISKFEEIIVSKFSRSFHHTLIDICLVCLKLTSPNNFNNSNNSNTSNTSNTLNTLNSSNVENIEGNENIDENYQMDESNEVNKKKTFNMSDYKEMREELIKFIKTMVDLTKAKHLIALEFLFPLIGFLDKDEENQIISQYSEIAPKLDDSGEEQHTFAEMLICGEKWTVKEQIWVINFLCSMLEDSSNSFNNHCIDSVMDALILATQHFGKACEGFRSRVVERCWIMMDTEGNANKIEKIALLSAAFLSLADTDSLYEKEIEDVRFNIDIKGNIQNILSNVMNGVSAAIHLD